MAFNAFGVALVLGPLTLLAGLGLVWYAWRRLSGRLRLFVTLIGSSLVLFVVSVVLHNGISWFAAEALGIDGFEEPVFFILAVVVCPLALVAGLIGATVTLLQRRAAGR